MVKFSVIVTVYNKQDYIERCLISYAKQDYKHKQLIIVDNGSTDDSLRIIKETIQTHEIHDVALVTCDVSKNVSVSRNAGLEKVTGDWCLFLDGDDYIQEHALRLWGVLAEMTDSPIMMSRMQKSHNVKPVEELNLRTSRWTAENLVKAMKRHSVAGVLYRKDFIDCFELSFKESRHYYADDGFTIDALKVASQVSYINLPLYIKGECYDPIQQPSLNIEPFSNKIEEWLRFFKQVMEDGCLEKNGWLRTELEERFLKVYFQELADYRNHVLFKQYFTQIQSGLALVREDTIRKRGWLGRKQIAAHLKGSQASACKWIDRRLNANQWRNGFKSRTKLYQQISRVWFHRRPLKKKRVLFESFGGKTYACNPRYIYEELQKNDDSYECIWAFNQPKDKDIPGKHRKVKRLSLKYYYYAATSQYWVMNARKEKTLDKRAGTIYVQTWHGTPLKRLAADMKEVKMPGTSTTAYKRNFYEETQSWDYLISPNMYSSKIFRRAFNFTKEMLDIGYPRNDLFYDPAKTDMSNIQRLKQRLNIPSNKKVVLYAPTWRDDEFYARGRYKFEVKLDLREMQARFADEYVVLLRMHYLIADNLDVDGLEGFVYNVSDYDDIAELYLISDVLITDYSSVFFDYANLKRPIVFYTYDLDKYRDDLRGFYIDFAVEAPGPLLETSEQVMDALENIESVSAEFEQKRDDFYNQYCHLDNGQASRHVVERVFKK
ncbi:CDP-glycerol:glycerophosphate glycerophosphotransferase [Bacillus sp. FSL W7-1360]